MSYSRYAVLAAPALAVLVASAACDTGTAGEPGEGNRVIPGASEPGDPSSPSGPALTPPTSSDAGADADAVETCTSRDTDAPPMASPYSTKLAGQAAWIHDEKSPAGYFHTYDAIAVGTGAQATPRKIHVFLPRSYTSACKRYPVVYMNDGDTAFFKGAVGKSWDVQSVLAAGYAAGTFGEVIVVAIHPLDRDREYTHTPWLAGRACCEVPAYAAYLANAMKPFIDGAYRTRAAASDTVIAGSSHGGLAAFYVASTRPDAFGKAIAMSSSFWVGLDDGGTQAIGGPLSSSVLMQAAGAGLTTGKPRLYLDWGLVRTGGVHNAIIEERATARGREMSALLVASYGYVKDESLFTVEDSLGEHDELSWKRRLGAALGLVLKP